MKKIFLGITTLTLLTAVFFLLKAFTLSPVSKTFQVYDIYKVGDKIGVKGTLVNNHEYQYHTIVRLDKAGFDYPCFVQLDLSAKSAFDEKTQKYIPGDPKLYITPVGCLLNNRQDFFEGSLLSSNIELTGEGDQAFNQTLEAGLAQLLTENKYIEIQSVQAADSGQASKTDFKKADPKSLVNIKYKSINYSFSMWYKIKFELTSEKTGIFIIE